MNECQDLLAAKSELEALKSQAHSAALHWEAILSQQKAKLDLLNAAMPPDPVAIANQNQVVMLATATYIASAGTESAFGTMLSNLAQVIQLKGC